LSLVSKKSKDKARGSRIKELLELLQERQREQHNLKLRDQELKDKRRMKEPPRQEERRELLIKAQSKRLRT